jgi:hypothetical protein
MARWWLVKLAVSSLCFAAALLWVADAMVLVVDTPHGASWERNVMLVIIIGGGASATDVSEIDSI